MDALTVRHLEKRYPSFHLRNVSFRVQTGRIMGFIGRNGAGKTTTMKSILNLVHPDQGSIQFFGMDMSTHEFEIKQRIACIFGAANYYGHSSLKTIADVYRRFYTNWDDALYHAYLKRFALDPGKKLKQLSQGMSIKFALALALSHHAELLILDEPTSGLDPVSRDELLHIFEDIVDDEGASILFSTHITSDLDKTSDDILYIKNGEIIACGEKTAFVNAYHKVEGYTVDLPSGMREKVVGFYERKGKFDGLVLAADANGSSGLNFSPADLESVMVCIERQQ